jgi:hypothetical protein
MPFRVQRHCILTFSIGRLCATGAQAAFPDKPEYLKTFFQDRFVK